MHHGFFLCILGVENTFETIFNIGCGGGRTAPLSMENASVKLPMEDRVNKETGRQLVLNSYIQIYTKSWNLHYCMSKKS